MQSWGVVWCRGRCPGGTDYQPFPLDAGSLQPGQPGWRHMQPGRHWIRRLCQPSCMSSAVLPPPPFPSPLCPLFPHSPLPVENCSCQSSLKSFAPFLGAALRSKPRLLLHLSSSFAPLVFFRTSSLATVWLPIKSPRCALVVSAGSPYANASQKLLEGLQWGKRQYLERKLELEDIMQKICFMAFS